MKKYDIIIVGAGASGVFMSYELAKLDTDASILVIDKGAPLDRRLCPIKKGAGNCLKSEAISTIMWALTRLLNSWST